MAKLGFGLYKQQIKDCVLNNIEKILFVVVGVWLFWVNLQKENTVMMIVMGVAVIAYTILFIFTLIDTIKAVKEYKKIRKDWENYGK